MQFVLRHPDGTAAMVVRGLGAFCAFAETGTSWFDDDSNQTITLNQACIDPTLGRFNSADSGLAVFNGKQM